MAITVDETFQVEAPLEAVWSYFSDPPQVVPCLPGASLAEVVDDRTYKGNVIVKVGPIKAEYAGTVQVESMEAETYSGRFSARGDQKGAVGKAEASVSFKLLPIDEARTEVVIVAEISVSGRIMQLGGGMIQTVSRGLFRSFSQCVKSAVENASGE